MDSAEDSVGDSVGTGQETVQKTLQGKLERTAWGMERVDGAWGEWTVQRTA